MKTSNNILKIVLALAIFVNAGFTNQLKAQTQSIIEEISFSEWVPCANDGNGEWVSGSLVLHTLVQLDKDLKFKKLHFQPQYSELVGQTTGERYKVHGADNISFDVNESGAKTVSYVSMYHIVGKSANFLVKTNVHTTVNANGEITSEIDSENVECK